MQVCDFQKISGWRNASIGIATVTQESFESQYYVTRTLFGARTLFAMTAPLDQRRLLMTIGWGAAHLNTCAPVWPHSIQYTVFTVHTLLSLNIQKHNTTEPPHAVLVWHCHGKRCPGAKRGPGDVILAFERLLSDSCYTNGSITSPGHFFGSDRLALH